MNYIDEEKEKRQGGFRKRVARKHRPMKPLSQPASHERLTGRTKDNTGAEKSVQELQPGKREVLRGGKLIR